MDKLILKNNREVFIEYGSSGNQWSTVVAQPATADLPAGTMTLVDVPGLIMDLTAVNMEHIEIRNDAGLVTSQLTDKRLAAADPITINPIGHTGNWRVTVRMADVDQLEKRLAQLEAGQSLSEAALMDLGSTVSDMAVAAEGGVA